MKKRKDETLIASIEVHLTDGRRLQIKARDMERLADAALLGLRAAVANKPAPRTKFDAHFELLEQILWVPRNELAVAILGSLMEHRRLEQRRQRERRETEQEAAAVREKLMAKLGISESRNRPR